jgi:hypothetical protein
VSMTAQNAQGTTRVQRIQPDFSQGLRELRRRDSLLRTAFLRIIAGFECRPSPRSPWDRAADGTQAPWGKLVVAIRGAILSARQRGDVELVRTTVEAACAFCDELKADFASLLQKAEEFSLVQLAILEAETEGAAREAEVRLVAHPSPTEAERAITPIEQELLNLGALLDECRIAARSTPPMVSVAR